MTPNKFVIAVGFLVLLPRIAFCTLGDSVDQLDERYGRPAQVLKLALNASWRSYTYSNVNIHVHVWHSRAIAEHATSDKKKLTAKECRSLINVMGGTTEWTKVSAVGETARWRSGNVVALWSLPKVSDQMHQRYAEVHTPDFDPYENAVQAAAEKGDASVDPATGLYVPKDTPPVTYQPITGIADYILGTKLTDTDLEPYQHDGFILRGGYTNLPPFKLKLIYATDDKTIYSVGLSTVALPDLQTTYSALSNAFSAKYGYISDSDGAIDQVVFGGDGRTVTLEGYLSTGVIRVVYKDERLEERFKKHQTETAKKVAPGL